MTMITWNLFGQPAPVPTGTNADGGTGNIEIELNIESGGGGPPDLNIGVDERSTGSAHFARSNEDECEGTTVPYHTNGRWTRFGKAVAGLTVGTCAITSGLAAWEWANPSVKGTNSLAIANKPPKEAKVKTPKEAKVKTPKGPVSLAPSFFPSAGPSVGPSITSAGPSFSAGPSLSAGPSMSFSPTTCDPNCVGGRACEGNTGEFAIVIVCLETLNSTPKLNLFL